MNITNSITNHTAKPRFSLDRYFERIGFAPGGETPLERLDAVHLAHLKHIPFENLDVYAGRPVSAAPDDVYEKLVPQRRGGYCFEMNSLFCQAARAMGFEVSPRLARVYNGGWGGFTHRMNVVTLGGERYLADVGFGGNVFTRPLLLREGLIQRRGAADYRILRADTLGPIEYAVQLDAGGGFADMLGFNDRPATEEDFAVGNFYTSAHPASFFRDHIMCAIVTEGGKTALFDDTLTVTENGGSVVTRVERSALPEVLRRHFGIEDAAAILAARADFTGR
jgi:N-hydroxyarylamine O-acetyltransferase